MRVEPEQTNKTDTHEQTHRQILSRAADQVSHTAARSHKQKKRHGETDGNSKRRQRGEGGLTEKRRWGTVRRGGLGG